MKKTLGFAALGLSVALFAIDTNSAQAECNTCNGYNNYNNYGAYYGSGFPDTNYYGDGNRFPNYQYPPNRYDYQSYYRPRYDSGFTYRGYRPNNLGYTSPYYRSDYRGGAGYESQFNFYNPGLIGH